MKVWTTIPDSEIRHVWKKADDDDCKDFGPVEISPEWYQDNGTPSCSCEQDLKYSHTIILKDLARVMKKKISK